MDLMVDKFQTLISEYNLIGFVVEYPYKESDLCRVEEIKKIINDLSKIRNFQSLKYTYWEESIATEDMDFVVEHHVEFILENLKPDLESKSKQIIKDFVVKKFVAARLLQIVERDVLENINASVSTFPQEMPKAEIEEKLQKRREELVDVYMASFVLQGFVDYGRLSSDKDRKGKMAERRLSSNKDRKGKMAERVPVIRLLGV
ncbi:hypothetical protein QYF36_020160 [Acer negundo]|nr:hypothetical protein QYF36_020160 [Acer negundo]